ncbi:FUSC family protein [Acinetobacter sp. 187]|uniref:FUSC family protein n=1 Tax=Acinetobacter lanii TaxID=2715163 RepID=A0A6G8S2P3_9GAMM|nr:FUSC family protein [Acinetobacter lanii]NHC02448.1 FUSC family protein [Acinetobacter lanii]QIO08394.1 FUSC family protein [Acinetobacter lanii]
MLLIKPVLALNPSKSDWIFAIKTFIAGILALYISFSLDLAYPMWSICTVFIIANPYAGMSASKSFFRILGTMLGASVSIIVTPLLIHTPWLFTLFLALWVSVCLYISLLDRTPRSYIFMLAGYTAVIISFTIVNFSDTSTVFEIALSRFLEISVGVVCSAIVTMAFFPMNLGPAVETQIGKVLKDTQRVFDKILEESQSDTNYSETLQAITRDIASLHSMAIHLSYERSRIKGMTKPLQEMLHQLSMAVANLVAMAERIKQLDQMDVNYRYQLKITHDHIVDFLKNQTIQDAQDINALPDRFDRDFHNVSDFASTEQQIVLASLKMDMRHFIQNFHAIELMWQRIQKGDYSLPEILIPKNIRYPNLHRDYSTAVRGAISAFLVVMISTGVWILTGWKSGYMMAEMAAVTACILTALDNPVPGLKLFLRGNIYASIVVFLYAFGIFPNVTEFWQLALCLAPVLIFVLLLYPNPMLTPLAVPMMIGITMGMGFHNRYHLEVTSWFDGSMAMIFGPAISIWIMRTVRAMSPDMMAQRILSAHYKAVRKALYLPYGMRFRMHLRAMLDRIGVLNSKIVQSETLKQNINLAIIECSAVVDLARIQELMLKLKKDDHLLLSLEEFTLQLDDYLRAKELRQDAEAFHHKIMQHIERLSQESEHVQDLNVSQRLQISLNNIQNSLCHAEYKAV